MTAPMVLDGPMNRVAFQAYIEQVLVPTLRRGDTVIMDNPPATRVPTCARRSKQQGQSCATCRLAAASISRYASRTASAEPRLSRTKDRAQPGGSRCRDVARAAIRAEHAPEIPMVTAAGAAMDDEA